MENQIKIMMHKKLINSLKNLNLKSIYLVEWYGITTIPVLSSFNKKLILFSFFYEYMK